MASRVLAWRRSDYIVGLAVLSVAALAVYLAGMQGQYYGDDYQHVLNPPISDPFYYFAHPNPDNPYLYRPIEAMVLTAIQAAFGLNPLPVHVIILILHVFMCWLVLVGMLGSGFARLQSSLAAGLMLVSQANALAVLSDDTLSQVAGALFGCASLWFAYSFSRAHAPLSTTSRSSYWCNYIVSVFMFSLSLFSKETSLSFLLMICAIMLIGQTRRNLVSALWSAFFKMIPFLLTFALYFLARWQVGIVQPGMGPGRYGFTLGGNILVNFALFLIAALVPVSSVTAFVALANRELPTLGVILLISFGLLAAVAYGWRINKQYRQAMVLLGLAVTSLLPVMVTNRVSELYIYNAMPFISALFGIGMAGLISRVQTSWVMGLVGVGLVLLTSSHILAVQSKAALLRTNGERSTELLNQIQPYLSSVPPQGRLVLVNPSVHQIAYSEYLLPGFTVLDGGLKWLNRIAGRDDFTAEIVDLPSLPAPVGRDVLALRLVGSEVRIDEGDW